MAEISFARVGYRDAENVYTPLNLRAQDIVATTGESAEAHILDEGKHVTAEQATLISGAAQKANLTAVIKDQVISADGTAVTVTMSVYNADANTTSEVIRTIPLASGTAAGAMPKEAYAALQQAVTDIAALKQQGGRYIGESFATKSELDAYVIPASVNIGDFTFVVDDETQGGATTRYICVNTGTEGAPVKGFAFAIVVTYDPVGLAGVDTAGIVKGSIDSAENAGKVYVEADGSMSVLGWDALNASAVKTTGNQSVGGVKTFTDEIVLPNKTADVIDDGTRPATEAQVYKLAQGMQTVPDATTSQKGIVRLDDTISSAVDTAATPNSVKTAYDEAVMLDAAFCSSEADMASKNLRVGAVVFMEVQNV